MMLKDTIEKYNLYDYALICLWTASIILQLIEKKK